MPLDLAVYRTPRPAKPLSGERVCKRQFGRGQKRQGVTPSASGRPAPVVICKPSFRGTHSPRVLRDGLHFEQDYRDPLEDIARTRGSVPGPPPRRGALPAMRPHDPEDRRRDVYFEAHPPAPPRGRAAGGDAGGVAAAGPPAGDGGWREGRRRRGRVGPSVRVGPGGRVGPEVRVGPGGRVGPEVGSGREGESDRRYGSGRRGRVGPEVRVGPGRVGWVAVAAGCKTCQGPSHRSRRVHISIPTMLMCTQRDRVNPPCHALHNGDHVRLPML